MMFKKPFAVMLALCLTGCWSNTTVQKNNILPKHQSEQSETFETELIKSDSSDEIDVNYDVSDEDFVNVKSYIPDITVDLRYATTHNFVKKKIYNFSDAWLRYGTIKKLILVQSELKQKGLSLKIWDGFRPPSAQFKLWEVCPNPTYVANPNKGFSSHSRGNTVDITLVNSNGKEVVMPTGFDDFSKLADRDYSDCGEEAASNALLLETVMKKYGFNPYFGEWWHFSDTQSYSVDELFEPVDKVTYRVKGNDGINMYAKPNKSSAVITKIPGGKKLQVVAFHSNFSLIEYNNIYGYVPSSYIELFN